MRTALFTYKNKIFRELQKENPASLWSYSRELHGKTSTAESLLDMNSKVFSSSIYKANTLNHHFECAFTKYDAPPDAHTLVINEQRPTSLSNVNALPSN
jgi:hypothetical protein